MEIRLFKNLQSILAEKPKERLPKKLHDAKQQSACYFMNFCTYVCKK